MHVNSEQWGKRGCADTNKGGNFDYLKEECSKKRRRKEEVTLR